MTEEDIRKIVREELKKNNSITGFPEVPYHQHNGMDSPILNRNISIANTIQNLSGAGAVSTDTYITTIASTGVNALTMGDAPNGRIKIITMITDAGDATLTPTNLAAGTTITFNDVGDSVILCFVDGEWQILSNNGCTVA